jgi:DNA primase
VAQGFPAALIARSGLVIERDADVIDRFRNRLMIPICRDTGSIVAFGGRSMESDQQPKYLNSPETAIYTKGRTLYGLHLTKEAVKQSGYAVIVEGYFDFAQLVQAGIRPVVASCGTALTSSQAQLLKRFASKTVISFDPDAAGQTAAARSCELLVSEGFQVNVLTLPVGLDPDNFIQEHGAKAYGDRLRVSRPYLEYLLDRAAAAYDLSADEGRRAYLTEMLGVAARIPDAAARDQFADRVAHRAQVLEEVVRAEIRKAAAARRTTLTRRELPSFGEVKPAEKGLIWSIMRHPEAAMTAMAGLANEDVASLVTGGILQTALDLVDWPAGTLPATLLQRLTPQEADLVQRIASEPSMPAAPDDCVDVIRRLRQQRERAAVQQQIEQLDAGSPAGVDYGAALTKKVELARRLER